MISLTKRIDVLEARGKKEPTLLWISQSPDGLEHRGRHYAGADALLCALGFDVDEAILLGWAG